MMSKLKLRRHLEFVRQTCIYFCALILSFGPFLPETKYHGYRSIRGTAAVAAIFFNRGRSGLITFFDQVGISITEELLNTLLGKYSKRVEKAEHNVQRQEIIRKRKEEQRLHAQLAEEEEMEYRAGMF